MHRLTAGAGYRYLLRHIATGDCQRTGASPVTAYYAESGNPPGRWIGRGLAGRLPRLLLCLLLGLGERGACLLQLTALLGQLLLGLLELLLERDDLLLGTVLALRHRLFQLGDVRLQPLVLLAGRAQLGRIGATSTLGRGRRGTATLARPEVVVLLDQARQLDLDDVEERVDLLLVVPPLADRWLLERDVVYFSGRQRHSVTSYVASCRALRRGVELWNRVLFCGRCGLILGIVVSLLNMRRAPG